MAFAALAILVTCVLPARAAPRSVASPAALTTAVAEHRADVPEFQFIREQAKELGIRVWLFGGTAAGYGHYAKWDLQRKSGDSRFQPDRFDYDYTNIYRSTQDADLVIDGSPESAQKLARALAQKFPHLQGSKSAWEIRLLKQSLGAKDALLDNPDYLNQHTDSNSTGMIELTDPPAGESVIRDLREWKSHEPVFLKDLASGQLHYYFSEHHPETKRAKAGDNPEIFSAVRLLTKAFQYELTLRREDWAQVQAVIDRFDPKQNLKTPYSLAWLEKNGKKLIQHAVNIEYAWDTLEKLGLRKKLIALQNNPGIQDSLAWWLSKEPLRDRALGTKGRTAREIFAKPDAPSSADPIVLAHETGTFLAYESITRAHTGEPNVLISRNDHQGEAAAFGDGFYTRIGRVGARNTGRTIRFILDPNAHEGEDFILAAEDYIVIRNKRAIRVIPESLNMTVLDYFRMLVDGKSIAPSDRGILEKLKRRMTASFGTLKTEEIEEIFSMVESQLLLPPEKLSKALFSEFFSLYPGIGQKDRVHRIIDALAASKQQAALEIINNSVLTQPWSVENSSWLRTVVRHHIINYHTKLDLLARTPHLREQLSSIEAYIDIGCRFRELLQQVILPYWSERKEFSDFIFRMINVAPAQAAIDVLEVVLGDPKFSDRFDWLETLIKKYKATDGYSLNSGGIFKRVMDKPHWANQARVVQLMIDLDVELERLVTQVLVPHWQGRPELPGFVSKLLEKGDAKLNRTVIQLIDAGKLPARHDPCVPAVQKILRASRP